ncbi:hypothetical protein M0802_000998 [Mischocyttarus mexicanus]|nr:hypothetical protein M0802_000998 [Mischocyttarus mexicanus]
MHVNTCRHVSLSTVKPQFILACPRVQMSNTLNNTPVTLCFGTWLDRVPIERQAEVSSVVETYGTSMGRVDEGGVSTAPDRGITSMG